MTARRGPLTHLNLARGFRGGERQTELLIRELAAAGHAQRLVARAGEPLLSRVETIPGLSLKPVGGIAGATAALAGAGLCHVHEGRGVQAAWLARLLRGTPYIITRRVMRPLSNNPLTRSFYRRAAAVVALSGAIAQQVESDVPDCRATVIADCWTTGEPDPVELAELRDRHAGRLVAGHIGALDDATKGQRDLIAAAQVLPQIDFVLVGSGPDEAVLKQAAGSLPNVYFAGQVVNIHTWLALFDLFVFPSRHEGLGSVLLDALRAGLPVVATRTGGIVDVILAPDNGLLVEPGDVAALADAIGAFAGDPAQREATATRNRAAARRYSPAAMAAAYQSLYAAVDC